jgi:hypothetical protein
MSIRDVGPVDSGFVVVNCTAVRVVDLARRREKESFNTVADCAFDLPLSTSSSPLIALLSQEPDISYSLSSLILFQLSLNQLPLK